MKKCPPGVICIENVSMFIIIISISLLIILIYSSFYKQNIVLNNKSSEKIIIKEPNKESSNSWFIPSYPYTNIFKDVLSNPYVPPLSDDRYFLNAMPPAIPINVSTNVGAVDTNYRQMGILTSKNSKGAILSLMGRPIFTNRDKWQYYTISDQHNNVKLPVSRNGKSCTNEYGCDRLFNGDTVYVEGINEPYNITIYDNDTIRYLPFL